MPANGTTVDLERTAGPAAASAGVRFASYNIHKCIGTDRRFDPARTARVIGEVAADVIAIQEADRRFGEREGLLDLATLERETGLVPVPVPVTGRQRGGHGWHGNLLMVRSGLVRDVRQIALPGLEPRGALVADVELAHGRVRVVAAHLGLLRHSRLMQVEALLAQAGVGTEHPTVLMGDLNEWRRRRRSALHSFAPRFGPVGHGVPSFPSYFPVLALDRILARPHDILSHVEAHDTPLARLASDHLPVKGRVRLGMPEPLAASSPHRPAGADAARPEATRRQR